MAEISPKTTRSLSRELAAWNRQKFRFKIALFVCIALATLNQKIYLAIDLDSVAEDGYAAQVAYVLGYWNSGQSIFDLPSLVWIHGLRTLVAAAFSTVEQLGGAPAVGLAMAALLMPLCGLFRGAQRPSITLLLPVLIVLLSYRSVLVATAIGYLLLHLFRKAGKPALLASFLFANLSSGAVLVSLLIAQLVGTKLKRNSTALLSYKLALLASLLISLQDKIIGFLAGDAGYESMVRGASGVVALLSRSTIIVSFLVGDYVRAITYTLIFLVAIFGIITAANKNKYHGYALVILTSLPTFFLEGLGVISLIVPILMFTAGVPFFLTRNSKIRNASSVQLNKPNVIVAEKHAG